MVGGWGLAGRGRGGVGGGSGEGLELEASLEKEELVREGEGCRAGRINGPEVRTWK